MLVLWLIVCGLSLLGIRKRTQEVEYLCKDETTTINGIFIRLVFLSHAWGCVVSSPMQINGTVDGWSWCVFVCFLGQLRVVPFLFFSGYGVAESIKAHGDAYIRRIPVRRGLGTFVNFDLAVLLFIILGVCLHGEFDAAKAVRALLGWDSYGNSHWYIFCIVSCYLMTWAAFRFFNMSRGLIALGVLMCVYSALMQFNDRIGWWNTAWAYFMGVVFSVYKDRCIVWLKQYWLYVLIGSFIGVVGFYCLGELISRQWVGGFVHNIRSICFMLFILAFLANYTVTSPVLHWCGTNLFPLYIYQRIPMIVICFVGASWASDWPVAFSVLAFLLLLPIVFAYKCWKVVIK